MANSTTYKISIQPQLTHIEELKRDLDKIGQDTTLNLGVKGQSALKDALTTLESLQKVMATKVDAEGMIDEEGFKLFDSLMGPLITKINTLKSVLVKILPDSVATEFDKVNKLVDELQKKLVDAQSKYKEVKKGWNTSIAQITAGIDPTPTANTQNKAVAQLGDITYKDTQITTAKQLESIYNSIDQKQAELSEEDKRLIGVYEQYTKILQDWAKAKQQELAKLRQEIDDINKQIGQASSDSRQGEALALDAPDISPQLKQATQTASDYAAILRNDIIVAQQDATEAQAKQIQQNKLLANSNTVLTDTSKQVGDTQKQNTHLLAKNTSQFGKAIHNVVSYGTALTLVRKIYTQLITTIKEMDRALTNMTVVTSLTREQAWNLTGTLQELATQTGMTSTEIADMTTKYLQQGKTLSDALVLTEAAAKAARIAGISGSQSIDLLTNAMNGFQVSADKAMEVSDKFAALAASAATDYEELATALSKVAAQANLAGMSMDFTLGMLTKGIEVTREAPETIGTALKTVIARMRELTDYGATLDDNMDVNRVAKALDNIGVSLMDENNEFRNLDEVLAEVGAKWDTLNKNQQANVAVALAGTRQQSRLIAMLQDFDRTQQLVSISMNSAGATAAQHRKYMQGLEAATTQLTTAYQQLITTFTNSDFAISAINGLTDALDWLTDNIGLVQVAVATIAGLGISEGLSKIGQQLGLNSQSFALFVTDTSQARAATEESEKALIDLKMSLAGAEAAKLQETIATRENAVAQKEDQRAMLQSQIATLEKSITTKQDAIVTNESTIALNKNTIALNKQTLAENKNLTAEQKKAIAAENTALNQERFGLESKNRSLQAQVETELAQKATAVQQEQALATEILTEKTEIENQKLELQNLLNNVQLGQWAKILTVKQAVSLANEKQALTQELVKRGYNETMAAELAQQFVEQKGIILTNLQILLNKNATKEEKKAALSKAAGAAMSLLKAGADSVATAATTGLTVASQALSVTIMNIPIIGWIIAIISLVIALVKAASKTKAFGKVFESLKGVFSGVMEIFNLLFECLTEIFLTVLEPAMAQIGTALAGAKLIINVVKALISIINGITKAVTRFITNLVPLGGISKKITNLFSSFTVQLEKWSESLTVWAEKVGDTIAAAGESGAEKVARLSEDIAETQEQIYDARTKSNTLQPLLDEYKELSAKATKSAEDLKRIDEIVSEIGQTDETFIKANGKLDIEAVTQAVEEANDIVENGIQTNFENAILAWQTVADQTSADKKNNGEAIITEEMRSGLSDYYENKALLAAEDGNITIEQAQDVANKLDTIFSTLSDDQMKALGKDQAAMDAMYSRMITFEQDLAGDAGESLVEGAKAYEQAIEGLSDTAIAALDSVYTIYREYLNLVDALGEKAQQALSSLGLTTSDYNSIQQAYVRNWRANNKQGEKETDEEYAKRQNNAFSQWFANAMESAATKGGSQLESILALINDQTIDNVTRNAIIAATTKTNQQAVEDYIKKTNSLGNLRDKMAKAQNNELTLDEYRELAEEFPEIFSDAKKVQQFQNGTLDIAAEQSKLNDELAKDLQLQHDIAQNEIQRLEQKAVLEGELTEAEEAQLENYKMQVQLTEIQLDQVKYAVLYGTELWQTYAKQTKELREQARYKAYINQLTQDIERNENMSADEKIAAYKQIYEYSVKTVQSSQAALEEDDVYKKLVDHGAIEVIGGEMIVNGDVMKNMTDQGLLSDAEITQAESKWDEWSDHVKTIYEGTYDAASKWAQSIVDKETEATQAMIDEIELRKEQYEEYFEMMDTQAEEQERAASKDSIVKQISALTGAMDGSSKSKLKDLQKQLADLQDEEVEAQKQKQRDALTASLDKQAEQLNNRLDTISNSLPDLIKAIEGNTEASLGKDTTFQWADGGWELVNKDAMPNTYNQNELDSLVKPTYNYSNTKQPEFNPPSSVSGLKADIVSDLLKDIHIPAEYAHETSTQAPVTIGEINIHTDHLDNNQDFAQAGETLAEAFDNAIRRRGINVNAKR